MKKYNMTLAAFLLSILLLIVFGCSDRGVNGPDSITIQEGGISPQNHVFYDELLFQINNEFQLLQMAVYVPKVAIEPISGGEVKKVPLLILLAPQDGNRYYYVTHGLQQVADKLISEGVIEPMAIACIGSNNTFGGFFYSGHYPNSGDLDTIFGTTLLEYLRNSYPFLLKEQSNTAISGFGLGAYGAFRSALRNLGTYGSVSAVDGPLDFDGADGNSGLQDLFADALTEQGLLNGNLQSFKSADTLHLSRMLIGAAYAFSPYDTLYDWHFDVDLGAVKIDNVYSIDSDSTTLVSSVYPLVGNRSNGDILLPFTADGQTYHPIWDNFWLPNNLENLLTPGAFNGVDLFVATSNEYTFGNYHQQTQSWINTLSQNYTVNTMTYEGYDGHPAENGEFVYDLLKDILIFHSNSFSK